MKVSLCFVFLFVLALKGFSQTPVYFDNLGNSYHTYVGQWVNNADKDGFYLRSLSYSGRTNDYVTFTFTGNKFEWYTEKKPTHGIVAVSIDNGTESLVDLYSPTEQHLVVYTSATVAQGQHTVKLRVTGTKNASSTGYYLIHDAFGIYQEAAPTNSNTAYGTDAFPNSNSVGAGTTSSAFGYQAMNSGGGPSSADNSAFGAYAMASYTMGSSNTAMGAMALRSAVKAAGNTAVGAGAMTVTDYNNLNTAIGYHALDQKLGMGSAGNTALGANAGVASGVDYVSNSMALGQDAKVTASSQVRIGNSSINSIGGAVSWSTISDGRFKKEVREDVIGLKFINGLRPVSYRVDSKQLSAFLGVKDTDANAAARMPDKRQSGFIAQEVEQLVAKSKVTFYGVDVPQNEHDTYSLRYSEFVVPLVKAVQELSALVEQQRTQLQEQQLKIEKLEAKYNETPGKPKSGSGTSLLQNTPNPFNESTQIRAVVSEEALNASIIVFNVDGRKVKELQVKGRGEVGVPIEGADLAAGMYLYSLIVDGELVDTKKMVLSR